MTENTHTDIAIIGGGLVGYTAALAFARAGFSVVLIESKKPDLSQLQAGEGRAIALAHTSCLLYQSLGLWPALSAQAVALKKIIISQAASFGKCRIDACDYDLNALGHIIPATHLASCLLQAVQAQENITLVAPFTVNSIHDGCINQSIHAKLILACDGTQSFAREYFNISVTEKNYDEQAIVANVTLSEPHEGRAFQRFTDQGVLALLPLQGQRMTSVFTCSREMKIDLFLLQQLFGKRTGLLSDLGPQFTYPLSWMQADQVVFGRTVLLGNAAHTISPIAAQGFNLALRDLALLYDLIVSEKNDIGNADLLHQYALRSTQAQKHVLNFTDKLTDWVKPASFNFLRSAGLFGLDHLAFIKNPLAKSLMGLSAHGGSLMREDDYVL